MKRLESTSGARRELRLALSRVRAAVTHMRYVESVNYVPPKLRKRVTTERRWLYETERGLCQLLGVMR